MSFDVAGSQIDGARDYQEDAFLITHLGDSDSETPGSLVVVADGMGGHAAGNVASNMAVQTFNRHISSNFPSDDISGALYEAVLQANGSITATVAETAALKGMGCTLVSCVIENDILRWVSVGDSHLYLLRAGELSKRNADHSYGGFLDRMAEAGTPVEPEAGFSRNMLMSALTGEDIAEIDCPAEGLELEDGDRVILCSDGVDTLSRETIVEIAGGADSAKECVDALLQGVEDAQAPRQDNTTVIVVDVTEKVEEIVPEPDPEPQPGPVPGEDPFPVEEAPKKSPIGLIVGIIVVLALLGGGAFMFLGQSEAPAPIEVAPEDLIVEDEDETAGEETDAAEDAVSEAPVAPPVQAGPPEQIGSFRDKLKSGGDGPQMQWVPSGQFMMGNRLASGDPDELPQHEVTVSQFAMGTYEITIAEYRKYIESTGKQMPRQARAVGADESEFPMAYVSWNDALSYTRWLSEQTGKQYSLPTEAQWEYAHRAGSTSAYFWGRKLGRSNAHCLTCDTGLESRRATANGRFNPNKFDIYDTSGNLSEWTYDCYHLNYNNAPTDGSVFEGGDCRVRVLRGGSFASGPDGLRSAARDKFRADKGNDQVGFRVIRRP
ncbi:MAG: SUMF1/EgtB/PvdO family nonheme iron enzyme [Pseudomonadota bacterium]